MIEKTTASQFWRWQSCVKANCAFGADNACDGRPLGADVERKPPCRHYKNGCKQPEIAACKAYIKAEIRRRVR